ncbi:MAG TPA: glycoside hydrolase family 43 protein [Polyangiaceae bacterium]|nr:glycoside hydrolase family 43 protein [Polyangiaceae bacterium]
MQHTRSRSLVALALLSGLALVVIACGDDDVGATWAGDSGDAAQESGGADAEAGVPRSDAAPKDGSGNDTSAGGQGGSGGSAGAAGVGGSAGAAGAAGTSGAGGAGGAVPECKTRITYGNAWMHGPNHPDDYDIASGVVTWDGVCAFDGANSYATLSNGWKPYFSGRGRCVIALDYEACPTAPKDCGTRVSYGDAWLPGPNHPDHFDDAGGAIAWNGACRNSGGNSYATLSNGWQPYFSGNGACDLSFRYTQCGGLFANPVVDSDCPDPGVIRDGSQYVMACTSGNSANAFPLRVSPDLVHWQSKGHVFPSASKPSWAKSDYWAPELHRVGSKFIAYYTARHNDGKLSVGAATADDVLGPYTDIGHPLLHDTSMGLIDANHFEDTQGNHYLLWKEDGNAVGKPTPIHGQQLAADGLSLVGTRKTLITNDKAWEGALVEGPWVIEHGGEYFLFYSANGYASPSYAIGVAKSSAPLGSYTKASAPILTTAGAWAGPGHGSVLLTPSGQTWHVYHSWKAGHVGEAPGRVVLLDRVIWDNGWPTMRAAPSSVSMPPP